MRTISRRLRRLEDILSPQEEEQGPSIAEILRVARLPGMAGRQVSPSRTVAPANLRERVAEQFARTPFLSWDQAIGLILPPHLDA